MATAPVLAERAVNRQALWLAVITAIAKRQRTTASIRYIPIEFTAIENPLATTRENRTAKPTDTQTVLPEAATVEPNYGPRCGIGIDGAAARIITARLASNEQTACEGSGRHAGVNPESTAVR